MTINSDYIEVTFANEEALNEILPALLMQLGFDSFLEEVNGVKGYIVREQFDFAELTQFLKEKEITEKVTFTFKEHERKNWNESWESQFDPVVIEDKVLIKAPFHRNVPDYPTTILIEPKMSFGTGHHETTTLIIQSLLKFDLKGKTMADIGCGTGVLSIAALKLGVDSVDGCDIDKWSFESSKTNKALNQLVSFNVFLGDVSAIITLNRTYDIVVANINKNILIRDLSAYSDILRPEGLLIISGFYESDCGDLIEAASFVGLEHKNSNSKNKWSSLHFEKK